MELPVFKPSGQGGSQDLANIYESQAISWGAYKGGLKKRFTKECGIAYIDGIAVYNDVDITLGVQDPSSDIYEMLKFIGFLDEDLTDLAETIQNGDNNIEKAILDYQLNTGYEQEDLEFMTKEALSTTQDFDYMTIDVRNNAFRPGDSDIGFVAPNQMGLAYNTESPELQEVKNPCDEHDSGTSCDYTLPYWTYRKPPDNPFEPEANTRPQRTILKPERVMENLTIRMWKNGQDISVNYTPALKSYLAFIAIVESTMVTASHQVQKRQPVNIIYEYYDSNSEAWRWVNEEWTENVTQVRYTFDNIRQQELTNDDHYKWYATNCRLQGNCKDEWTDEQKDQMSSLTYQCCYLWLATSGLIFEDTMKITNDLFYMYKGEGKIIYAGGEIQTIYPNAKLYITVDGLKKSTSEIFGYYMSQWMNIEFIQKESSFLEKFVAGIMRLFATVIDALIGLFLAIPILKQFTEIILNVIGSVFNVGATGARAILGKILMAIIMIIVSIYIGPMISSAWNSMFGASASLGSGVNTFLAANASVGMTNTVSTLVTYSSRALSLFNSMQQAAKVGQAREYEMEKANNSYRDRKMQEELAKNEALLGGVTNGTMGGTDTYAAMNDGMYNIMFNPFYYFPQAIPADESPNGYLF